MTRELLVIRADADARIGAGHVMRMLALAQAWQDGGGTARFVCRPLPPALRQRLAAEGMDLVDLPEGLGLREDAEFLARATPAGGWACLDGYHFDTAYQRAVRRSGLRTLVMDDANDRGEYEADVLVNQNAGAETIRYRTNPDARLLLGLPYALLRREFLSAPRRPLDSRTSPRNILITLGGADPANVSREALWSLAASARGAIAARVLIGGANPRMGELKALAESLPYPADILPPAKDMAPHLLWADLAVAPVSSTCWELLFMEVPFVSVAFASCQTLLKMEFLAMGVPMVDWGAPDAAQRLGLALTLALADGPKPFFLAGERGLRVDGLGAKRVSTALRSCHAQHKA